MRKVPLPFCPRHPHAIKDSTILLKHVLPRLPRLAAHAEPHVELFDRFFEGHLIAELLCEMFRDSGRPMTLVGLDVVEVNPLTDQAGETARMANEWVASLFGNTIMGAQI